MMGIWERVTKAVAREETTLELDWLASLAKDYDYSAYEPRNQFPISVPGLSVSWTDGKSYAAKSKALMGNVIAKACIEARATAIANIDLLVVGNADTKAVLESPSAREPTLQTALNNWETVLAIGGDLFLFYDLSVPGLPQIHSFRPDCVKNDVKNRQYLYDPSGAFTGQSKPDYIFDYDFAGRTTLAQRRVGNSYVTIKGGLQHVCYYDPRTAIEGVGAGDAALTAVDILNAVDDMIYRKVRAGGAKAGFFQITGQPTDAEMEDMKRQLATMNSGEHLNVMAAGMSFVDAQLTWAEMGVPETQEMMAKRICNAFRVPPEQIGEGTTTYANKRGADKMFYRNFIGPEAHMLVGHLQAGIRTYIDPRAKISVNEASVQHLEEDQLEAIKTLAPSGCLTINEIRAIRGLPPIEGGEALCSASVPQGQPEEKPKGPVSFNADAGSRGDKNDNK